MEVHLLLRLELALWIRVRSELVWVWIVPMLALVMASGWR